MSESMSWKGARPAVLFLCVHNAGRSQMAAGFLRSLGRDGVNVLSAGSNPGSAVNAAAVEAMAERDIDISAAEPRRWTDDELAAVDVVITMGCGDECPLVPGTRYEDWPLDDPAGQGVDAVRPIRDRGQGPRSPRPARRRAQRWGQRRGLLTSPCTTHEESTVVSRSPRHPAP